MYAPRAYLASISFRYPHGGERTFSGEVAGTAAYVNFVPLTLLFHSASFLVPLPGFITVEKPPTGAQPAPYEHLMNYIADQYRTHIRPLLSHLLCLCRL